MTKPQSNSRLSASEVPDYSSWPHVRSNEELNEFLTFPDPDVPGLVIDYPREHRTRIDLTKGSLSNLSVVVIGETNHVHLATTPANHVYVGDGGPTASIGGRGYVTIFDPNSTVHLGDEVQGEAPFGGIVACSGNSGIRVGSERAEVVLMDDSTALMDGGRVTAHDDATVFAHGDVTVNLHGAASAELYGHEASATAQDHSTVTLYGTTQAIVRNTATWQAFENSRVTAFGRTRGSAHATAAVELHDAAHASLRDESSVTVFDPQARATIHSRRVGFSNHSGSQNVLRYAPALLAKNVAWTTTSPVFKDPGTNFHTSQSPGM